LAKKSPNNGKITLPYSFSLKNLGQMLFPAPKSCFEFHFFVKNFCIFKNYHIFVKWQKLGKFLMWQKCLADNVAGGSKNWPRHNLHPNTFNTHTKHF
jgi:hypothetical protein